MADKRITDVDIIDSFNGDLSFFINQNNSIKQINKKDVIIPISNGGTGVTTIEDMKNMLGVNSDVVPIERGGTGATTARAALINLGAMSMISRTVMLDVDAWNNNEQTVDVDGVTADNVVIASPRPTFDDYTSYTESGIYCSAQFDGGLIFTCKEVPSMIITVNVAIFDANNSTGGNTGSSSDSGSSSGGGSGSSSSSGGTGTGIASVTQTTTSTEDGGVNIVTVTLTNGTTSTFRVRNGSKGSKPVKGTDYWTEADKAEIKSYIDNELLGGAS